MEAQLRIRFERLLTISRHPIRRLELQTLKRLLYRNRNQHRHGCYFRKLEHIRRLLSRITGHVVWSSIKHSLGKNEKSGKTQACNPPLSLSSLMTEDLKSLEGYLDKLVNFAIIEAARRVVTDLVCRQHFMPFAMSIMATIARIFVVERHLLTEVRGAVVEVSLLFASSAAIEANSDEGTAVPCDAMEDVGRPITVVDSPQKNADARITESSDARKNSDDFVHNTSVSGHPSQSAERKFVRSDSSPDHYPDEQSSLYDVLAKQGAKAIIPTEVQARTSVSLNEVLFVSQQPKIAVSGSREGQTLGADNTTETAHALRQNQAEIRSKISEFTTDNKPAAPVPQRNAFNNHGDCPKDSNISSDSEELDEIFGALEDS